MTDTVKIPASVVDKAGAASLAQKAENKEGMKRIQVGLSGLIGVVLLVGLANIVVDSAHKDDMLQDSSSDGVNNNSEAVVDGSPSQQSEPLAELGVTPTTDNGDQQPVVADLQPDPNLKEPLDRAPAGTSTPAPRQSTTRPTQN